MSLDLLQLRGLRASGICGALPEERQRAQPLEVDLDVSADLARATVSDELADTLDYGELAAGVERVVTTETFTLLERLAGRLCELLLSDERVHSVTVTVRKLRPPVPQQLDTAGVRLTRTRGS
jgi:7,8-dihydroneopterin aldolase/epimerase/oxygenase